jgi:signal transduction histidine kinase
MTRRLVLSYLMITLLVLALLQIPLAVFYSQREEERLINDAERDAVVIASFYEDVLDLGFDLDPRLAEDYAATSSARIVLVDEAGISLLDTDAKTGRDFSTRPEIATALTGHRAAGIRRSDTLGQDLLFVAVPVASGGTVHGATRLTVDAQEVTDRIRRFWGGLVVMAAVVLSAVAGVGWAIARSVTKPIRELQHSARRFADGDLRTDEISSDAPREVADLSAAMNTMARRLDQLITAQRSFVSDASHQLRTPLTALRLRLENLEAQLQNKADAAQVEAATKEIERLSTLVDDLLRLARAEQPATPQLVDVVPIVADRVDTWTAVAAEAEIDLELHTSEGAIMANVFGGAVEQILDNTIDNAIRMSHPGQTVAIHIESHLKKVRVLIRDHGPGLPDADKSRAIQRFWRADPATPGTGLGLAIADTLATASEGQLLLQDTPGGGLTVIFEFPQA